jgi:16S rRNA (adenine1518-N6/adenine1519-N6)-dimethyltransferase
MSFVRAKKSLGQHFLKDENIARKIVESLLPITENVVEVGAGMGVLTKYLIADKRFKTTAVEIDRESVDYLKKKYPSLIDIIHEDFLDTDVSRFGKFSIIGNFPYNISSQIFFKALEHRDSIPQVVCMIQKEVAERISSKEGNKVYGILSVLLQAFYKIEYLFTVNETVFAPPPKVKSAVVRFTRNTRKELDCDEKLFFRVVKTGFNQRRKTLRNSLKPILGDKKIDDPIMDKRPEQLNVEQFIGLTKMVNEKIQQKAL